MEVVYAALFCMFLGISLESFTSWIAIRGAKKHHPELWTHSGEPTVLGNRNLVKSWPLVSYYKERKYLLSLQRDGQNLPPITDEQSLRFAEKLRLPLLYTYYAGWAGIATGVLLIMSVGLLSQ